MTVAEPAATAAVDKRSERIKAMFAGVASRYDLLNHVLSLNIDRWWRRFTVQTVRAENDAPILDLCTGTGDLALGYKRAVGESVEVVAADFCHPMLVQAVRKSQARKLPLEIVEADALNLPFPDDRFQIVSVAFGLRNVSDTRRGIAEMQRVAQPGGRVAILEFSKPRAPILGWCYLAYFKYVLPAIGQAVSKSQDSAYHYLPASVLAFPDGAAMIALLEEMGLTEVRQYPLTLGIATLYVGRKSAVTP